MSQLTCCGKPMTQLAFLGGGERWGCKVCKRTLTDGNVKPLVYYKIPPDLQAAIDNLVKVREEE